MIKHFLLLLTRNFLNYLKKTNTLLMSCFSLQEKKKKNSLAPPEIKFRNHARDKHFGVELEKILFFPVAPIRCLIHKYFR